MFNVKDSAYCTFQDILFLGDNDNPPSAGIFFEESAGGTFHGTNKHHLVRRCHFGRWPWTPGPTGEDGQMTIGLRWGGQNTNNDQYIVEDCVFRYCTEAAVKIESTQSIWGCMRNIQSDNCGAAIDSVAAFNVFNLACHHSTVADLILGSSALGQVTGMNSERAAMIFKLTHNSAALFIDGGHVTFHPEMTGPNWGEHHSAGGSGGIALRGLRIFHSGVSRKKLYARGNTSSAVGFVRVEECPHLGGFSMDERESYDIQAAPGPDGGLVVTVDTGLTHIRELLTDGEVLPSWS